MANSSSSSSDSSKVTFGYLNTSLITFTTIPNADGKLSENGSDGRDGSDSSDGSDDMLYIVELIGSILYIYYVPFIVCTGTIGNLLSVVVFFRTKLRKLSSSYYLAALACSDTCFLFSFFAQWLNFVNVNIYNREYYCQFFTFLTNLASFCSSWFVVAFTVERFIAVMYPLKRQSMCTVRRAKIVLLGLWLLGSVHCAPFWWSSRAYYHPNVNTVICDIKTEYKVGKTQFDSIRLLG